jgi:hypothetical protein
VASAALDMDGIPFLGQSLRMRRPEKYPGPVVAHRTWVDVINAHAAGAQPPPASMMAPVMPPVAMMPVPAMPLAPLAPNGGGGAPDVGSATAVVRLTNVLTVAELEDDGDYGELLSDLQVWFGSVRFGEASL